MEGMAGSQSCPRYRTAALSHSPSPSAQPGDTLSQLTLPPPLQFQTELRKILLSLIEVAQKLLALSPGAVELFTKANGTCEGAACPHVRAPAPRSLKLKKLKLPGLLSAQQTWVGSCSPTPAPTGDR